MKTSAPSSPPPSDDSDSDWEPAERKPAKKRQQAGRAAKGLGRGVGEFHFSPDYDQIFLSATRRRYIPALGVTAAVRPSVRYRDLTTLTKSDHHEIARVDAYWKK